MSPTLIPGIVSSILAWSHTFVKIDHKIKSGYSPPSANSVRVALNQ